MEEKKMSFKNRLYDAMTTLDGCTLIRMEDNDPEELKRRVDFCDRLWTDGRRFTVDPSDPFLMYRDEKCDESEEIKEVARHLIAEFRQKTVDRWLKTISHDDAQRIIDALDHDPDFTHSDASSITYNKVTLSLDDFADRWNKANGVEQSLDIHDKVYIKPHENDFSW